VEDRNGIPASADAAQLMAQIRGGSVAAMGRLIDRFWEELVRYAARDLTDTDAAQDVVQEAFIQVWERRRSWIAVSSGRAYLYRIVRSLVIDEKRKRKVRQSWVSRVRSRPPAGPPTPAEVLEEERILATYRRTVAALPERRREVFTLVFLEGLSHDEAASVLNISTQTVANQMATALRQLRNAIRLVSEEA
jgi:RNA polymerase sigma-70 factor (ECF subfamily)